MKWEGNIDDEESGDITLPGSQHLLILLIAAGKCSLSFSRDPDILTRSAVPWTLL
jgi:hypothetical protein